MDGASWRTGDAGASGEVRPTVRDERLLLRGFRQLYWPRWAFGPSVPMCADGSGTVVECGGGDADDIERNGTVDESPEFGEYTGGCATS